MASSTQMMHMPQDRNVTGRAGTATKALIGINVVVFVAQLASPRLESYLWLIGGPVTVDVAAGKVDIPFVCGGLGMVEPDRRPGREPVTGAHRREPVRVGLEGLEEPLHPAALAPTVLVGGRPRAELLAVVAHRADPVRGFRGVLAQVIDDLVHLPKRDPVAKALLGAEHAQPQARGRAPV